MRILNYILIGLISFASCSCEEDVVATGQVDELLWLENKGAQMPIWVEGKASSKTFILILHGGPGGSSLVYNDVLVEMANAFEQEYAVAYWDQRSSGNAKGNYDKEQVSLVQMEEDLDLVIDLLKHKYGSDISLFLLGHSWGGYLGNYYLRDKLKQLKLNGWIDVDGAHNLEKLTLDGLQLMEEVASEQIRAESSQKESWQEVLDFATDFDTSNLAEVDRFIEVNTMAGKAESLALLDGLTQEAVVELSGVWRNLAGPNHPLTGLTNAFQLTRTKLLDEAIAFPLTDELGKVKIPSLLLWGKYDFIVPPSLGEEMLDKLGTPDARKSLIIYEDSGHSPMGSDAEGFIRDVMDFIDLYK